MVKAKLEKPNKFAKLNELRQKVVTPITAPIRKQKQARLDKQKELTIAFGEQDAMFR